MKRNTLLTVVIVIAGIFILFNPLQYFNRNANNVVKPATDIAKTASLLEFAQASWRSPEDYVIASFAGHDIVFLGEYYKIKEQVQFASGLIPKLYAAGIRNLGIEYALSDDQKDIDALVTAPQWDEAAARAITRDWLATWGYQEYIDLYKAAWQLNHDRPAGAQPFRIVGLQVRENWEYFKSQSDANNPDTIAKIYGNGIPDAHIAQVIDAEFVKKNQKALVFCGIAHIYTRYHNATYEKNAVTMKLTEKRRAGAIIYDEIGARAFCISLHSPWADTTSKIGLAYPVNGFIDNVIDSLPDDKKSGGWDTTGTALGALSIKGTAYDDGGTASTLADLFDGYVVLGPITKYTAVTPIKDFIPASEVDQANARFPGVKPAKPLTIEELNQAIVDDAEQVTKTIAYFR